MAFGVDAVLFENGFRAGGGLVDAGDDGFVCAVADEICRAFAAHEQCQCVHQDGLACAGFAGEQIEAGAKDGYGVIDDGVVFCAEFYEHGLVRGVGPVEWPVGVVDSHVSKARHGAPRFFVTFDALRVGVVVSHPCARKKAQGWGTGRSWVVCREQNASASSQQESERSIA